MEGDDENGNNKEKVRWKKESKILVHAHTKNNNNKYRLRKNEPSIYHCIDVN